MPPYNDLSDFDFQIINAVYRKQSITLEELEHMFPNQHALQLRIELLATPDKTMSSIGLSHAIENTSYLEFEYVTVRGELGAICNRTNTIHITALGIKAIEDWEHQHHKDRKALWENRFWKLAPIIISFTALLKSFWPELTNLWQVLQSTLCTR